MITLEFLIRMHILAAQGSKTKEQGMHKFYTDELV